MTRAVPCQVRAAAQRIDPGRNHAAGHTDTLGEFLRQGASHGISAELLLAIL
ncbi:hypothetical protein ACLBKU_12830 [Erythrobacter sp. NE805]|uniref:hypothetical protein n=1 Tax=Erythrobacter sp. NE805 TaxID=3389875 RepID=UPI00396B2504